MIIFDLPIELVYKILSYNDEYNVKQKGDRILIYDPTYKIILKEMNFLCALTDHNSVKKWRIYNRVCMKYIYPMCNYHDFHLLLNHLSFKVFNHFVEIETVNMLHHLSQNYNNLLRYIHKTKYPKINADEKRILYGVFWDYCKFYYMMYYGLNPIENSFLL